jgi:hypothetical protein
MKYAPSRVSLDPYTELLRLLDVEAASLSLPRGPRRRRGVERRAGRVLDESVGVLGNLRAQVAEGRMLPSYAVIIGRGFVEQIAYLLYAAGADHPIWRRWLALAAVRDRLAGDYFDAACKAAIAGEWSFLATIPETREVLDEIRQRALWHLFGGRPRPDLTTRVPPHDPWVALTASVPAGDHAATRRALLTIARSVVQDDPQWNEYRPLPGETWDESAYAAAAIARHRGFRLSTRPRTPYDVLEPGAADGDSTLGIAERFSML